MSKNIIIKINEDTLKCLEYNQKELNKINNDNNEISNIIRLFLTKYEKDKSIDFELLKLFFDKLDIKDLTIEYYQENIQYLEYCKANNKNGMLTYDIEIINKKINQLINIINTYQNKLFGDIQKTGYKKKKLKEKIEECTKILSIIQKVNNKQPITEEDFSKVVMILKNDNYILSEEDKVPFIAYLTEYNTEYFNEQIKEELKKEKLEQERKQQEQERKKLEQVKIIAKKEKEQREKKKVKAQKEKTIKKVEKSNELLNAEDAKIFSKAKELAETVKKNYPEPPIALSAIKKESVWKERLEIYNATNDILEKQKIICYDLLKNIIPELEKGFRFDDVNQEMLNILKKAVNLYEDIEKTLNETKEKPIIKPQEEEFLKQNGMTKHLDLYQKVEEILGKCIKISEEDQELFNKHLFNVFKALKYSREEYIKQLNNYINSPTQENLEMLDYVYELLKIEYEKSETNYEKNAQTTEDIARQIERGQQFYGEKTPIKNIFVFTNGNKENSTAIEEDIKSDKRLPSKIYEILLKGLQTNITEDLITSDNHKAKSDNYSNEFLEKYKVRSIKCGDYRIFYSLFGTNSPTLFGGNKPNIIFVHTIGYGATDGNAKEEIHDRALKSCYEDKENIDRIVSLLNTDLSDSDKKETIEYLNKQYQILGQFIEKSEKKDRQSKGVGKND